MGTGMIEEGEKVYMFGEYHFDIEEVSVVVVVNGIQIKSVHRGVTEEGIANAVLTQANHGIINKFTEDYEEEEEVTERDEEFYQLWLNRIEEVDGQIGPCIRVDDWRANA